MIWNPTRAGIAAIAGIIVLGTGAIALSQYTAHVRADAEAQATIAAQATYQKQLTSQMADLQKAMSDRDSLYQSQLAQLGTKFQAAQSPQQIAQLVASVMGLKQPVTLVQPLSTAQNPQPELVAQIPLSDAPQVKAYVQECETCKLQLPKLQADLADRQAQMALAQKQIESLQTQRDAAIKAEKGGSWLRRTGRALKYIGIGAAIGGAAICASGHCK